MFHGRLAGYRPAMGRASDGSLSNFLRLSFAHYDEDDIREGIARMRPIFD
jgi:DNA-binding transcriptional MocR family regulator